MNERQPQINQPEASPIDEVRSKESLATTLDEIGVVSVDRFPKQSRNDVYVGQDKSGQKYIIKLYTDPPERRDIRTRTEVTCYSDLGERLPLPTMVAANEKDGYLVTEFMELSDLEMSKEGVDSVMDLLEQRIATTPAPSLIANTDEYYETKLPMKVRELAERGLITAEEAAGALSATEAAKSELAKSPRVFSHQDFVLENIKRGSDGNLVLIDPEFARQDVPEYDPISLWADLSDEPELADHLAKRFNESKKFNPALFKPLAIRRCVEILRGLSLRGKQDIPFGQKHSRLLKGLLSQKQ